MIRYYKVGGCVRDEILGVKSKDIDFAVEAESYEAMRDDIKLNREMEIFQERPEYFAIRARHPELGGVDFTLCRKEGFYSDARHPDSVTIGTIYDDLARRDFTVNAIAKTEAGEIIDPYQGTKDLQFMQLHFVGNAVDRINEDSLRILRAVRFHIVRGFDILWIDKYLYDEDLIGKLKTLPIERVYEELVKCYDHNSWQTLMFFKEHPSLERIIFKDMGLSLSPRIPFIK